VQLKPAIIVTGATSGIGRALLEQVAKEDADIVLVARSLTLLQENASVLQKAPDQIHILSLDLANSDAGQKLDAFLADKGLFCDVLVANAGIGNIGLAASQTLESQMATVDLNVRGTTELCLRMLPGMVARGRGGLLIVSSVASVVPGPGMAVYFATKAYLRMLSEALWYETSGTGVTVTCLAPGPVDTPFIEKSNASQSRLFSIRRPKMAEAVAGSAWRGFKAGKRLIIPGTNSKISKLVLHFVPQKLLMKWLLPIPSGDKTSR
jgi:uncharacterized protein